MAFLKNTLWLFLVFPPQAAQACPACLTLDKGGFINQRVWLLGIMGLLPLFVAAVVVFKISKICRSDSSKMTRGLDQ